MAPVLDTSHSAPPNLTNLISSYSILTTLSSWISALDLYHLALTNRRHHSFILSSPQIFKVLTRQSLCDGRGLADRQEFRGLYKIYDFDKGSGIIRRDEPVEVRLYNLKCDEAGALPCVKCGVNVCEECRYYPRTAPSGRKRDPQRRPHLNASFQIGAVMCLCPPCDAAMEKETEGKFLNELCDCDALRYWICSKCRQEVDTFTGNYRGEHTALEGEIEVFGPLPTKQMNDAGWIRALWCICGETIPRDTRMRCTWCKRRHLPEEDWFDEWDSVGSKMPWFDDDPDYPHWQTDGDSRYPVPYPKLGYKRPGD
ncbi:hypothetical protein CEP54_005328 [Fusarium duplospermum]|uniref:Uncharacterized protein n=1 Tax=Fusarium duplospermum TaxID=1325734 RepID=A0A428QD62_9HYPO|nr:hypothetical protein CEP54_005328 [Fusarium duplospermum]